MNPLHIALGDGLKHKQGSTVLTGAATEIHTDEFPLCLEC